MPVQALQVFLARGYQGATIEQLARAAGVTKRTIYADYGDKAGLFAAMVEQLAGEISHESDDEETVETLATRIVFRTHSDELVGLHRLVMAESVRFPELAASFHQRADARHIAALRGRLVRQHGEQAGRLAVSLFSLLLGEPHRCRLLGITRAPTQAEAARLAAQALDLVTYRASGDPQPSTGSARTVAG